MEGGYRALEVMERHLAARRFFVDERYTIADIALYAYTHVAHEGDFHLGRYPNVRTWLARVASQPGTCRSRSGVRLAVPAHRDLIVEQFTKQAVPFSTAPGVRDEEALRLLVDFSGRGPRTRCSTSPAARARGVRPRAVVRHATGIDVTPAMIERARALAAEKGLGNVGWQVGDVLPLPYPDGAFSLVVSRFAFHHFPEPRAVLAEMKRVCAPGGRVALVDVAASEDPAKAAALNRMEKLRDPSHVRVLTLADWRASSRRSASRRRARRSTSSSRSWRAARAVVPGAGDAERVRRMLIDSLDDDGLAWGRTGGVTLSCSLTRSPCSCGHDGPPVGDPGPGRKHRLGQRRDRPAAPGPGEPMGRRAAARPP